MQSPDTPCAQVPRQTRAQEDMELLLSWPLRVQCVARRQKSWSQPFPQTLGDSLDHSTQGRTETCDNRGRRTGSRKNQSPEGRGHQGQQGPQREMVLEYEEGEWTQKGVLPLEIMWFGKLKQTLPLRDLRPEQKQHKHQKPMSKHQLTKSCAQSTCSQDTERFQMLFRQKGMLLLTYRVSTWKSLGLTNISLNCF